MFHKKVSSDRLFFLAKLREPLKDREKGFVEIDNYIHTWVQQ